MATFVSKDIDLTINSIDYSEYVQSFSFPLSADAIEETAMGDDSREYIPGLKNATFTIGLKQDFAASKVDASMWAIYDGDAAVAFVFRKSTDAVGATNPEYTGNCVLTEYPIHGDSVGDLATTSVTFQITGDVARATS